MNLKQIEQAALGLSLDERAALVNRLMLSIASPSEGEIAANWLDEALRRAKEIDEGVVQPIPAEEVRRKAESLLRLA